MMLSSAKLEMKETYITIWLSAVTLCCVQGCFATASETTHTKNIHKALPYLRTGRLVPINDHVTQTKYHVTDHVTDQVPQHDGRAAYDVVRIVQQKDRESNEHENIASIYSNTMDDGPRFDQASVDGIHRHRREVNSGTRICTKNEYQCDNGECIPIDCRCDGATGQYGDCKDLSDEDNCHNSTCPDHLFHCVNGQCIYPTYRCDGSSRPYTDCKDGSDEMDCYNSTCPEQFFRCDNGQCVIIEQRCDNDSPIYYSLSCNDGSDEVNCADYVCPPKLFKCKNGFCVSIQSRCDNGTSGYPGCADGSDEEDCETSECGSDMFRCADGQCINLSRVCDGHKTDCNDGSDENNCDSNLNVCPNTFRCSDGRCMEDFTGRCDGLVVGDNDCPDGSDEIGCGLSKCPKGMYRCRSGQCMEHDICSTSNDYRCNSVTDSTAHCGKIVCADDYFQCGSGSCLHPTSRCDDVVDCPDGSDEYGCGMPLCRNDQFVCNDGSCIPMTMVCDGHPKCANATDEANDVCQHNETNACVDGLMCMQMGSRVCIEPRQQCDGLSQCQYSADEHNCFTHCPSSCYCVLGRINCSNESKIISNGATDIWPFEIIRIKKSDGGFDIGTDRIHTLILSKSNLRRIPTRSFIYTPYLHVLDLSYNLISVISPGDFSPLYRLSVLNLSDNMIDRVNDFTFKGLRIFLLDLRNNKIKHFSVNIFAGMAADGSIFTDSYKFCCNRPKNLPEHKCLPHADQFSSCDDLIRDVILRSMLWTIGVFSFIGNIFTLIMRMAKNKKSLQKGYGIFVSNLGLADLLMGLYLLTIAVVDEHFRGVYITQDAVWRHSGWCTMSGVLSMLSSEASVFFICLITIDRYLVVRFPFGEYRIRPRKAILLSAVSWLVAFTIAVVPTIFDEYFNNEFFSKNGVCVALPLMTDSFTGWEYSVGVYVCLNCALFTLIGIGQLMIYCEIIATRRQSSAKARGDELKIARGLMLVVASDFLCWIPIGCFGILAMLGRNMSPDVYAWIVILVLPVNSALNPFLYTLMSKLC